MSTLTERRHLVTGIAIAVGSLPLLTYTISNYLNWLSLGKGGLPHNPIGYLSNCVLQPFGRSDQRGPAPYKREDQEKRLGTSTSSSFLDGGDELAARAGPRPNVPGTVAPQRQTTEKASPLMERRMQNYLAALVVQNPELFQLRPSELEGRHNISVWLVEQAPVPELVRWTKGEFVHPHGEGSSHLIVSLADAERLVELGWAERHKLSGVVLPWGFIMVYAPRNDGELEVWKKMVVASARYISGRPDVVVP
jgi:hypothetical protein